MAVINALDDKLADGYASKVSYHVEANFMDCHGWQRNAQEHDTLDDAQQMARHFRKIAAIRIVKIEITETVVTQ